MHKLGPHPSCAGRGLLPRPEPTGGAGVTRGGAGRGGDVGVRAPGPGAASGEGEAREAAESTRSWWKSRGVSQAAAEGAHPAVALSPHHPSARPWVPDHARRPGTRPHARHAPRAARCARRTCVLQRGRGSSAPTPRTPYARARDRPPRPPPPAGWGLAPVGPETGRGAWAASQRRSRRRLPSPANVTGAATAGPEPCEAVGMREDKSAPACEADTDGG